MTVRARLGILVLALIACVAGVAVAVSHAGTRSGPVVTLIGDSVAARMEHNPAALNRLNRDFTLNLQTRGCRRLATQSCTIVGEPAPPANVVTLAKRLGPRLGRIVVVATIQRRPLSLRPRPPQGDAELRRRGCQTGRMAHVARSEERLRPFRTRTSRPNRGSGRRSPWPTGTATAPVVPTGSRPTASTSPSLAPRRSPCSFSERFAAPHRSSPTGASTG